jgi:phosphatidylserine/phosphatidylglycerophosphate/cardiolipin synthase-like enzyme
MRQYSVGMSQQEPGNDFGGPRLRVLVQPDDGIAAVTSLIAEARRSILVKMFTFTSPVLVEALHAAVARGIAVRVLLNPQRSSGTRANDEVFKRLNEGGVACAWTTAFPVTHEKSMVLDDRLTLIATFNFCDKYFTQTRDYGIVVDDVEIAREVSACFEADWHGQKFEPSHPRLIWSNATSRRGVCDIIDNAKHSLILQHPKFSDVTVLDRLLHAQDRGVRV